ncbi:UDP-Gal or UDP-GlcNAc-dependent glycosyltransferase [Angomonas deanei]|uniref:Galactosyltransferase, putative n=1 Tax=Angomonas deanei TaxID=59799 RepID=A0A7G2CIV4_9TRYP|nr:UDP-Gal or UDP-GlcNAc-dependent glycosyltransferase [Angomonas deanei]CAD2218854.1 Galactosyltransferase, putative [Angomonas deanei]|eukprot:EPY15804.1 UDP-Gal or UDP-GlcNAc-dependent glycosyltransferase [Angomonas deanei]
MDSDRRSLRHAQRDTFMRYNGVATRRNGFRGRVLYLYVLAAHYSTTESLSVTDYRDATATSGGDTTLLSAKPPKELRATRHAVEESLKYLDVLWMTKYTDAAWNPNKKVGNDGHWGIAPGYGVTHKLMHFLLYAYYQFPETPFIGKGDDDAFFRVPQILQELENTQKEIFLFNSVSNRLQVKHVYWGSFVHFHSTFLVTGPQLILSTSLIRTMLNMSMTRESNHATQSSTKRIYEALCLAFEPYSAIKIPRYVRYRVDADDVYIAVVIKLITEYERAQFSRAGEQVASLTYFRRGTMCSHIDWVHQGFRYPNRRNTVFVHGAKTALMHYQLFVYFSDLTQLLDQSSSAMADLVRELRWEENDAYDKINFTVLQKSPRGKNCSRRTRATCDRSGQRPSLVGRHTHD